MATRRNWRAQTLGLLIGMWLICGPAMTAAANSVSLAWDPNPEADLAGYKVYTGTSPGAYTQTFDVGHETSYSVADLNEGETYYFVVTAYDIYGNESDYSREISTTIASAPADTAGSNTNSASSNTSNTSNTSNSTNQNSWSYWWNLLFGS